MRYLKSILETNKEKQILKTFKLQDNLCTDVWDYPKDEELTEGNTYMKADVRKALLNMCNQFVDYVGLEYKVEDIVLIGSLVNYNWSEYSDFDVHFLIDMSQFKPDAIKHLDSLFSTTALFFNNQKPMELLDYEVEFFYEIIVPDVQSVSNGKFSILNNEFIKFPDKISFDISLEDIDNKSKVFSEYIDHLDETIDRGDYNWDKYYTVLKKLYKKIKGFRIEGLKTELGEFSLGNLTFKYLKRTGQFEKLRSITNKIFADRYKIK